MAGAQPSVVAVLSFGLYATARPFSNHEDNALVILASAVLVLAKFSGLLISAEVTKDDGWSLVSLGSVLAGCTVAVVLSSIVLVVLQAKSLLSKLTTATSRYRAKLPRRESLPNLGQSLL